MLAGGKIAGGCAATDVVEKTIAEIDINGDGTLDLIDGSYCGALKPSEVTETTGVALRNPDGRLQFLTRFVSDETESGVKRYGFDPDSYNVGDTDFYVKVVNPVGCDDTLSVHKANYRIGNKIWLPKEAGGGFASIYGFAWDVDYQGNVLASLVYYVKWYETRPQQSPIALSSVRLVFGEKTWPEVAEEIIASTRKSEQGRFSELEKLLDSYCCREHSWDFNWKRVVELRREVAENAWQKVTAAIPDAFGQELAFQMIRHRLGLPSRNSFLAQK